MNHAYSMPWRMMRQALMLLLVVLSLAPLGAADRPRPQSIDDKIEAKAVLLIDAKTREILFQRNIDTPYPPASVLKLLTALIVYEKTKLEGNVTVEEIDTRVEPSSIPLKTGETVPVRVLVESLLVASDNDSGMALARHVSGSVPAFSKLMNQRARELGCTGSYFTNPHGLPDKQQIITASDLMIIFRAALAVPEFRDIMQRRNITLTTAVGTVTHKNHNKLLGKYTGMGPAKTGWTVASRHTYAAAAVRNGHELQLVLLNSPNKWNDATALFDYGFSQLEARDNAEKNAPASSPVATPKTPPPPTPTTPAPKPPVITAVSGTNTTQTKPMAPLPAVKITPYKILKGDTLYGIAKKNGVSVPDILKYNSLTDIHKITPGMIIYLPLPK